MMIENLSSAVQSPTEELQAMRTRELWAEYQNGNEAAFGLLVSRCTPAAHRVARRYFHNPSDAQDIVQEAWLKVVKSAHTFDPSKNFHSWFYTIVANHCRDRKRREASRITIHTGGVPDQSDLLFDPPDTRMNNTLLIERSQELDSLLPSLAEKYRVVIEARREGYSNAEIASLIGRKEVTVRWLMSEARKQLQVLIARSTHNPQLEHHQDDPPHVVPLEHPNPPSASLEVDHAGLSTSA